MKNLWLLLIVFLAGCVHAPKHTALIRFEFEQPEMGSPFKIVLYAASEEQATNAADKAYARVAQLNSILSDYDYESELSRLGRTSGSGQAVKVSDELWTILKRSQEIARASDGAFDITIAPLIQLWRKARREHRLPSPETIASARERVGYTNLVLNNHTATLRMPNMRLDVGGIAKGYAADEAMRILRAHGIRHALVAASGDMVMSDAPPGTKGWKVEIPDYNNSTNKAYLSLHNCGLSTSGDQFQFVEIDGRRYSHVVDVKTGYGLTDRSLATVISKDGLTADSLETTITLLGPERGLRLARKYGAQARASRQVEGHGRIEVTTDGFWNHASRAN